MLLYEYLSWYSKISEKHDCIGERKQAYLDRDLNSYLSSFISSVFCPDSYSFLLATHADDCSTNFITIVKLFANHSQQLHETELKEYKGVGLSAVIRRDEQNKIILFSDKI